VIAAVALALCLAAGSAGDEGLVRAVGAAEIDWGEGVVKARAGSAADYHLPSADMARPAAERRARSTAVEAVRAALEKLPLGEGRRLSRGELDGALAKIKTVAVDYQSNGGALVSVALRFADVGGAGTENVPARALAVGSMPLELAPRLIAGEEEVTLPWAVYRLGSPPAGADAVAVRRDRQGRLVIPRGERRLLQKLAGGPAVIYVQKILK
jgi:hypothetical protein